MKVRVLAAYAQFQHELQVDKSTPDCKPIQVEHKTEQEESDSDQPVVNDGLCMLCAAVPLRTKFCRALLNPLSGVVASPPVGILLCTIISDMPNATNCC